MSTLVERLGDAMVAHVHQVLRDYGIPDDTIANDPEIASTTREVVEALSARITPPAEVGRYEMVPVGGRVLMQKNSAKGEWVRYEDHAAALAASAEREAHWRDQASAWESLARTAEATLGTETAMRKEADARAKAEAELRAAAWARVEQAEAALAAERAARKVVEAERDRAMEACEIIAGRRQCLDNLMSNQDVARAALSPSNPGDAASPKPDREGV